MPNNCRDKEDLLKMKSYIYVGDYNFNLLAASLLRKDRSIKDYFYNIDQGHMNLKYKLNEIENLSSLDDLMSVSYSKIIITNLNSSNLISALVGMGLIIFSVINPTTIHKAKAPMQPVSVSDERDKPDGSSSVSMRQG